ncbi:uncharacterized protein METZ01_LOCUS358276, partial [marine metagenome]
VSDCEELVVYCKYRGVQVQYAHARTHEEEGQIFWAKLYKTLENQLV